MKRKLYSIWCILHCANYIVITDHIDAGEVSPLYAEKFLEKVHDNEERLRLMMYRHEQSMKELADALLPEDK